jgi:Zn finger protein HypA/HybF involved in hydrogenase expression
MYMAEETKTGHCYECGKDFEVEKSIHQCPHCDSYEWELYPLILS